MKIYHEAFTPPYDMGSEMTDCSLEIIQSHAEEGIKIRETFFRNYAQALQKAALKSAEAIASGGKVLFCGNGGSAADSQHLAAEFVNRFMFDRPALPAIALTTDSSVLTAIGNDASFAQIFARQVEALGHKNDILVAISTSGNSPNILEALNVAHKKELFCIGLTGLGGGEMSKACDIIFSVPTRQTPLIQEIHISAGHLLCRLVDYFLFENVSCLMPFLKAKQN